MPTFHEVFHCKILDFEHRENIFSLFQSLSLRYLTQWRGAARRYVIMHEYRASSNLDYVTRVSHLCEFMSAGTSAAARMWCYHAKKVVIDSRAFTWPLVRSWRETWTCDSFEHVMLRRTCDASIDRFKCILWWTTGFSRVVWKFFNQC